MNVPNNFTKETIHKANIETWQYLKVVNCTDEILQSLMAPFMHY
jgi:hypothetical protein